MALGAASCSSGGPGAHASGDGGFIADAAAGQPGTTPDAADAAAPADAVSVVESGSITCGTDSRVQSYRPGIQTRGSGGTLTFVLADAAPGPPARGLNVWTVEVLDGSGQLVSSPSYTTVKPWMPDHGHGPSLLPTVMPNPDGTATIGNLDFFMPGVWQVTLQVQADAGSDTGVFTFCID